MYTTYGLNSNSSDNTAIFAQQIQLQTFLLRYINCLYQLLCFILSQIPFGISGYRLPLWLLRSSRVYSVRPLQLAGHFDVLDGSNGSCGQGNGGWTNQVNFWALFFQMENLMGNWCKIIATLC